MFSLDTRSDSFVTTLERAAEAAGHRNGAAFNDAYDDVVWSLLTPAEQAEMYEYGQAKAENFRWDRMIERQMNKHRMHYTSRDHWHQVPWTDDEKRAERARFQGKEAQ